MPATEETLGYESRAAGALEPGEIVWWEDVPGASIPTAEWFGTPLRWTLAIALAAGVVVGLFDSVVLCWVWGICAPVAFALVAAMCWLTRHAHERGRPATVYRVTDRRVMHISGSSAQNVCAAQHEHIRGFSRDTRRDGSGVVGMRVHLGDYYDAGSLHFPSVRDPDELSRLFITLPARSGRRRRLRRSALNRPRPVEYAGAMRHTNANNAPDPGAPLDLTNELALQADEVLLWSGRPRTWETLDSRWVWRRVRTVAWLLIPTGIVLARLGAFGDRRDQLHWIVVVAAAVWLAFGAFVLLVQPFIDAWRRAHTQYFLTSVRAITVYTTSSRRRVGSMFLDMISSATLEEHSGGTGNVAFAFAGEFERIERARQVYDRVTAAVRAAGTTAPPGEQVG